MPRRAEKYRRLVWLRALPTDGPADHKLVAGHTPERYGSYVDLLIGGYNLWLEMEKNGDVYILRCYPRQAGGNATTPRICASYEGVSLARLLLVAAEDYREYMRSPGEATLSPFEFIRYVA